MEPYADGADRYRVSRYRYGAFYAITVALDRGGVLEVRQSTCAVARAMGDGHDTA